MCCILDASYILNSDSSILEKLKACPSLTSAQAAAVQARMINGNTRSGYVKRFTAVADFHSCLFVSRFTFLLLALCVPPNNHRSVFVITRAPSVWTEQTLKDLGMLSLYMSSTFYDYFNTVSNTWPHTFIFFDFVSCFFAGLISVNLVLYAPFFLSLCSCEQKTKNNYLRYFLGVLKENNVDSQKIGELKSAIRMSIPDESKRSTGWFLSVNCSVHVLQEG